MNTIEFLTELRKADITVKVTCDRLQINAPSGAITESLKTELKHRKKEIIHFLKKSNSPDENEIGAIPLIARDSNIPPSFAQQRLWFLHHWEPNSAFYNSTVAFRLRGTLHVNALQLALRDVVARHESLRTTFLTVEGSPQQHIQSLGDTTSGYLTITKLGKDTTANSEAALSQIITDEMSRPFDLAQGPLMRACLFEVEPTDTIFILTFHHIIIDGWSMNIFLKELTALYATQVTGYPVELPPLPVQYADFTVWQRHWLQGEVLDQQLTYWRTQLAEIPPHLDLPTDAPRPPQQSYRGGHVAFTLPPKLTQALKTLSQQEGVTLFMVLLTAFQLLLFRYTGQRDILVGTPIAGRAHPNLENLIGCFINTLVLRAQFAGQPTFRDLLHQVRETCLEAFAHQDLPFEKLVDALQPERDPSRHPLFQVMFQLDHGEVDDGLILPQLEVKPIRETTHTANFDLLLALTSSREDVHGGFTFNTDLFAHNTISRMATHYHTLLEGLVAEATQAISHISLLTDTERHQLLFEWNQTTEDYPHTKCVHQLFEEQVERTPDAIAVVFEHTALTYAALNDKANQLAHFLRSSGVGPEKIVAIAMERSLDLIVSLLGTLKTGAAYLPLEITYPQERLAFMIDNAKVSFLLTHQHFRSEIPVKELPTLCLDTDCLEFAQNSKVNLLSDVVPENCAYVMYTSGSTGRPKGVMISHAGLTNYLIWCTRAYEVEQGTETIIHSSIGFDLTVTSLFPPLLVGGRVRLLNESGGIEEIAATLRSHSDFCLLKMTPTHLEGINQLFRTEEGSARIRTLILGGEALLEKTLASWKHYVPKPKIINEYGPTETAVGCCVYEVREDNPLSELIPIGRPIINMQMYLLDQDLQPVPVGIPSEVYIGGVGVARGYQGRPDLTAERFIPHLHSTEHNARLYKTGDLGRFLPDGNIEFLGRMDSQIKIRGHRIEPEEVQTILGQYPEIHATVVMCQEDSDGEKCLVAYLVPNSGKTLDSATLRQYLKTQLPDYMLPAVFVILESFPLTLNGKVNRQALPKPDRTHRAQSTSSFPPRTPLEEMLAEIWRDLLKVEYIGVHDNFFELGGHSLLATQVVGRTRTLLQTEVSIRTLFEGPTIAQLATSLEAIRSLNLAHHDLALHPQIREGPPPLSFAQQRLWFLTQWEPKSTAYQTGSAFRLRGPLDIAALEASFTDLAARHESLRTVFLSIEDETVQVVLPPEQISLSVFDLSSHEGSRQHVELQRLLDEDIQRPFVLTKGPLFRTQLFDLGSNEHVLHITFHHIIIDGWSMNIFLKELTALYTAHVTGHPIELPSLPIQYADFAIWQRHWLQGELLDRQLTYWRTKLAEIPPHLNLQIKASRPPQQTYRGGHVAFTLPPKLTLALKTLSQQEGMTLFMVLLAAFQLLLFRYTGQRDILIGTPIAGRTHPDLEGLIGFFVNTLVLRTQLTEQLTFRTLLRQVRETCLEAYAHQDLPFEKLVDALQPARDPSHHPLFQVMFQLDHGEVDDSFVLPQLEVEAIGETTHTAKFDLSLALVSGSEGLHGVVTFNTDLFAHDTMNRLATHYHILLEGLGADSTQRLSHIPLLTDAERHQLLIEWNHTTEDYPRPQRVHQLFEEQVERTPDAIAVVFVDQQLTYRALNERANQLAHFLRQQNVGPEVPVGLCLDRSLEMVIGLLAILKAGGAYVPLDPSYPTERLAYMLTDTDTPILLTFEAMKDQLSIYNGQVFTLDWSTLRLESCENLSHSTVPANLAYVLYTSGSTGRPKGVLIAHESVVAFLHWARSVFPPEALKGVLAATSIGFDLSVFELFFPLSWGGMVVLAKDVLHIPELPAIGRVTLVNTVPSAVESLLEQFVPPGVHTINLAGEPLNTQLVDRIYRLWSVEKVYDLYGPSEATTYATFAIRTEASPATIGRPLTTTTIYLLDQTRQLVPIGVPGELLIGGYQLARGYLERPDLTAEKFIPHSFSSVPGARLYRTGDQARYRSDGNIEFLGRLDQQIKLRGYRIELGEIEVVLNNHPEVSKAVVLCREDIPGEKQLVAYVVPTSETTPDPLLLRQYLQTRIPDHMVPAAFVILETLPLTSTGKINRHALPEPDQTHRARAPSSVPPRTPQEGLLAEIWGELLEVEHIGVHDNFFELGGHSLLATLLLSRVRKKFKIELPLRLLFDHPTLEEQALAIEEHLLQATEDTLEDEEDYLSRLLDTLDSMSEEEVQALLEREQKNINESLHPSLDIRKEPRE